MALERIVSNLSPKVRRETWEGRQYLVAPLTLIVPGVLNGSRGPLLYPVEEVAKDPGIWNGVPLTVGHPRDTLTNEHVSGRSPPVIERMGIGYVFNDRIDEKGHRVAEGWFDIAKTRTVDKRILAALEAGKPIELSTGLYTDNEPAPAGATANGRPYAFTARNYRSDHVAILPDESGACSVNDGCGVLVNETLPPAFGTAVSAAIENSGGNVGYLSFLQRFLGWFTGNTEDVSVVNAPPNQPRSKVTGRLKRLNAGTGVGDAHESAQRGALQLTDRDRELGKAAAAEKAATGNNPASWVADEDIWEKAKAAADKGDYEKDSDTYWAVVAHIYEQMGGTSKTENQESTTKDTKSTKNTGTESTNNSSEGGTSPTTTEGDTMPMTKEERQKAVANLTANCSCKESKAKEEVALNQLSDEFLKSLLGNVQAGTAASKGFQHGGKVFVFNGERGKFVVNAMKGDAEDEAECDPDSPDYDEDECKAMNKKTKNATKAKNRGDMGDPSTRRAAFARMVEDGDCDTCDDDESDNASKSGKSNVGNSKSLSDWLDGAPPEIRSVVTNAMAVEKQARVQLVRRIVANLEGAQRKRMIERLADKPLDELRDLALLTRPTDNEAVPSLSMADYSGAAGAPVDNQADFDESDVGWAPPTMNWGQMAEENRKTEGRRRA